MRLDHQTLAMFLARIAFFRLHESPRYLVHAGRPQEALVSLQMISRFNGSDLAINLEDVHDHRPAGALVSRDDCAAALQDANGELEESHLPEYQDPESLQIQTDINVVDANGHSSSIPPIANGLSSHADIQSYLATRESPPVLEEYSVTATENGPSPLGSDPPPTSNYPVLRSSPLSLLVDQSASNDSLHDTPTRRRRSSHLSSRSRRSSVLSEKLSGSAFPRWIKRPLIAWLDRVAMVLSPQWVKITLLVWSIWFSISLCMFSFRASLPRLLTPRLGWRVQRTLCSMSSYQSYLKLNRAPPKLSK
jgi:hypothetical protein